MKERIKKYKNVVAFVAYAIISFVLIFYHENWRDEAQAWLIAKNCNLIELIRMPLLSFQSLIRSNKIAIKIFPWNINFYSISYDIINMH